MKFQRGGLHVNNFRSLRCKKVAVAFTGILAIFFFASRFDVQRYWLSAFHQHWQSPWQIL